jgi:RND family efflux transporter MFP subunit
VEKGDALIDVEPSPAARLSLQEAQINLDAANKDLAQTQQRFDMKLATNSDLLQSQQAVQLAQFRLDNLKQQGLEATGDAHRTLPADSAGLIDKIDVQQGQIVAAGNPLVETIARDQVEVRLGVEPSEMRGLTSGQAVQLFPVSGSDTNPTAGKIRLITQRVNPDTRLVDVFVTPQNTDNLLLEGFTRAELSIGTRKALIAPRQAVLPDEDGYTLFTVKDGKAVKHTVRIGLENDQEVEVIGDDLAAGDTVVIQGNYELDDGMAVATTPAAATPAETKP